MSISLKDVSKAYGDVLAVDALNLECPTGKMLALLGPSGCGKSSTLKMIAGIEEISAGAIHFGQKNVSDLPPGARNIAMVFEDYALYPHLSVEQNIAFPLELAALPKQAIRDKVGAMLSLLSLEEIRGAKVRKLSGGAQQRVALGRALVRDPDVILFDEPLSHLDADQKVQLRTEIKRLQQTEGLTSILVTHDQTEAIAMSDVIAVMDHGVLQQVGSPDDLYRRPANTFVATFIGEPPMNLMPARLDQGVLRGAGWALKPPTAFGGLLGGLDAGDIIVGVRPEHLRLGSGDPGDATLKASIFFREHRGDTDILLVEPAEAPASRINAEVPGPSGLGEGDGVTLSFAPGDIILFDGRTGRNAASL